MEINIEHGVWVYLGALIAKSVLMVQLIRIRLHHVDEVGKNLFLFDRYGFEMLHDGLQKKQMAIRMRLGELPSVRHLRRIAVPCSCRDAWPLCSGVCSDAACLLVIGTNRLRVSRCRFRCYHLQTPSCGASFAHIECGPCGSHKCIYAAPVELKKHISSNSPRQLASP